MNGETRTPYINPKKIAPVSSFEYFTWRKYENALISFKPLNLRNQFISTSLSKKSLFGGY